MDRINYIRQLNAFWEMQGEPEHLKPSSYTVYFSLLQINNTCGWKDPFLATYSQVLNMTGIANAKTYYSALEELSNKGYVTWLKSKNQYQAPSFSIKVLYQNLEEQLHSTVKATTPHTEEQLHRAVSIPKQLNKKLINNKTTDDTFEIFWNLYGNKTNKKSCEKKWSNLNEETKATIIDQLPSWLKHKPFETYTHPNPLTYLNGERWNDELPIPQTGIKSREGSGFKLGAKPIGSINYNK